MAGVAPDVLTQQTTAGLRLPFWEIYRYARTLISSILSRINLSRTSKFRRFFNLITLAVMLKNSTVRYKIILKKVITTAIRKYHYFRENVSPQSATDASDNELDLFNASENTVVRNIDSLIHLVIPEISQTVIFRNYSK